MNESKLERILNTYNNHINSWLHSLRTYENGLKKSKVDDIKLVKYWNENIVMAKWKIATYNQVVSDLKSLLDN